MAKIFVLAGDMSRDPKEIAAELYKALSEAAMDARVEPSQRSLSLTYKGRTWTDADRERLASGALRGAFAGPNKSFPVAGASDVQDAWRLSIHAENPDAVRKSIIEIARTYGWGTSLPYAASEWEQEQKRNVSK